MANKYSRYELQPFESLYVDNKQPEIATLLSQRYDQNKQSKDLIERTLSQMQLLDGDKIHGERVKGAVKDMLKSHIDRGDWENSTLVVQDAAQLVTTDAGLIAANESFKIRQAEIQAIRDAKLNGIPMIDFGADYRKTHESYVYDEETDSYVTNIYEPMSEKMLDYRTRKEKMIGRIPADQRGNFAGVTRGKTNKIANLVLDQYISDTHEGQQEFRKLVEIDLPQSLPVEERIRLAKNAILEDFKEVARQQEFNKVTAPKGGGGGSTVNGLKNGLAMLSTNSTKVDTRFDKYNDKVNGLNLENIKLFTALGQEDLTDDQRDKIQQNIENNNKLLKQQLKKVADANGEQGQRAYDKYLRLEERFNDYGEDGQKLLAMTQYLTYAGQEGDTDWGELFAVTATTGTTGAVASIWTGPGALVMGGVGAGVGFVGDAIKQLYKMRNVRDWHRPQEGGYVTGTLGLIDNEREQLAEELWGDEDLKDANVDKINKTLGTNFGENDLQELMKMTNAYYTFMIKDGSKSKNGKRMTGDQMFKTFAEEELVSTQPLIGFDASKDGKTLRTNTSDFVKNNLKLLTSGVSSDGLLTPDDYQDWYENGEGDLQFVGVKPADIMRNIPMKLSFGFEGDATGSNSRDFYVTDPTVIQPGGWVSDLVGNEMGLSQSIFDENIRKEFNATGYDNVTVNDYTNAMAIKQVAYAGGTQEDVAAVQAQMQDQLILDVLLNPTINLTQFPLNSNGKRTITSGQTGQEIPFVREDGSVNEAAWITLKSQPNKLASLRNTVLNMSLNKAGNLDF